MEKFRVESKVETNKGHTYVQWTVGIIANSLFFTYGLQTGWLSPMAKVLQSQSTPMGYPLSDSALGWVASVMPITALVFVPVFSFLADKYGRRTSILMMTVPQAASWLLKLFFSDITSLILARTCSGISAAGCFAVIPVYNSEISQETMRGLISSLLIFSCNFGLVVMYTLGAYFDYYTVLYVVLGMPFLSFVLMLSCPESPEFLVKIEKYDEATETIAYLRGLDSDDKLIQNEVDTMRKHNEYYKTLPAISMTVILSDAAWRKAFILSTILISTQTFSGNCVLVSYGASILAASEVKVDAELLTISFPAVMMVGCLMSMCVVERVGRKVILSAAYLVSAAALAGLAMILQLQGAPAWLLLTTILVSMFAFAGGVMPVPFIVMSEMFSIQVRAKIMGIVSAQGWVISFAMLASFAPITDMLGMHANFYFFSASQLLAAAVVLVLMPETRGKCVEQIEKELRIK